jgi:hypothetical protein
MLISAAERLEKCVRGCWRVIFFFAFLLFMLLAVGGGVSDLGGMKGGRAKGTKKKKKMKVKGKED